MTDEQRSLIKKLFKCRLSPYIDSGFINSLHVLIMTGHEPELSIKQVSVLKNMERKYHVQLEQMK